MNYDGLLQFFLGSGRGVCMLLLTLFTLTEATSIYKSPPSWIPAKVVGLMQKKGKAGKSFRYEKKQYLIVILSERKEAIRARKTILILKH